MEAGNNDDIVDEYARTYPPLITTEQAAEIAHVPVATIHAWSASNLFDAFKFRAGRRMLLRRDDFVRFLLGTQTAHVS